MGKIKSAEKRHRQSIKLAANNRVVRGSARTATKKARQAVDGNSTESREAVLAAMSALDRAATKGVIHKNNAARRKSRLMKALNKSQAE